MSFEQISYLAQIVASVGVIVSLIFVGVQIRQNTAALQRNEHNSTMAQWTVALYECWPGIQHETNGAAAGRGQATTRTGAFTDTTYTEVA
jgi:hypothetical protein